MKIRVEQKGKMEDGRRRTQRSEERRREEREILKGDKTREQVEFHRDVEN